MSRLKTSQKNLILTILVLLAAITGGIYVYQNNCNLGKDDPSCIVPAADPSNPENDPNYTTPSTNTETPASTTTPDFKYHDVPPKP